MSTSRKSFERLLLLHQKFARASVHELARASVLNNQVRAASNFGASTSSSVSRYSLKPSITSSTTSTTTTSSSMTRSPMFNHVMFKLKRGAVMNTSSDAIRFGSSSSKRSFVTTALFPNLTRAMNETGFRKIVFAKRSPNTSTSSSGEQTTMAVVSRTMRTSLNNRSSSSSNSSVYRISVRAYAKSLSQMKESGLKAYKPTTPGFRGRVITDRSKLWKGKPLKQLTKGLMKSGGRNNHGRITVWHKGGGHKRLYREIDFKRDLYNVAGVVRRIEYDPNRTTRIALIDYPEGNKPRYILAPDGTKAGDVVMSGNAESTNTIDLRPGNAMSLSEMPIGTIIHNVELVPGKGGAMARSAGASATLVKKGSDGYCAIKLPSGELRLVPSKCVATVGVLSNREHQNINLGKAGAKRWKGVRPTVRGTAMNPIDHPHGGGEGRSKGDNKSVSPWGVETKGKRTRNNKRTDSMRLQRRPMNRKRYPLLVK